MKILMTGMASSHCAIKGNVTFFSGLYKALSEFAEVTICEPELSWTRSDLEKYDAVILGLTPPLSVAANKLYGALHLLDLMYESPRLRLVVDSPQIWQFKNSIAAYKRSPLQIFSRIYSGRKDYSEALENHSRTYTSLADKMSSLVWPKTYIPLLPWQSIESASSATGFLPASRCLGIQIDAFFINRSEPDHMSKLSKWAVDNVKVSWWEKISQTLRYPGEPMTSKSRTKDIDAEHVIKTSIGSIIAPQERKVGTWWSYRFIQSLNLGTPVATFWQDTVRFSESWSKLAYQIEDMDPYDRQALARTQFVEYVASIPSMTEVSNYLKNDLLDSTKERM